MKFSKSLLLYYFLFGNETLNSRVRELNLIRKVCSPLRWVRRFLSASGLSRVTTAILKFNDFNGTVFHEKPNLFSKRQGCLYILDHCLYVWTPFVDHLIICYNITSLSSIIYNHALKWFQCYNIRRYD